MHEPVASAPHEKAASNLFDNLYRRRAQIGMSDAEINMVDAQASTADAEVDMVNVQAAMAEAEVEVTDSLSESSDDLPQSAAAALVNDIVREVAGLGVRDRLRVPNEEVGGIEARVSYPGMQPALKWRVNGLEARVSYPETSPARKEIAGFEARVSYPKTREEAMDVDMHSPQPIPIRQLQGQRQVRRVRVAGGSVRRYRRT